MKIALVGYGKMGKEIETIALERGHTILLKITKENTLTNNIEVLKQCDVAIEFTTPANVLKHIEICFNFNIPIVVGTTGWNKLEEKVIEECKTKKATLFYASNFSIGVNLFFEINKRLAQLMNLQNQYNVSLTETHHTQKLDAPSGTAITLANGILQNLTGKQSWELAPAITNNALEITAIREENVPGTHTINYESKQDVISITHQAKNRQGFAMGAVIAAEFVNGKTGVFGMNDILKF